MRRKPRQIKKARQITGNLYRGNDGKFQAGGGDSSSQDRVPKPTSGQTDESNPQVTQQPDPAAPVTKPNAEAERSRRDQWQADEDKRRAQEDAQVDAARSPKERAALRRKFAADRRKRRAEERARRQVYRSVADRYRQQQQGQRGEEQNRRSSWRADEDKRRAQEDAQVDAARSPKERAALRRQIARERRQRLAQERARRLAARTQKSAFYHLKSEIISDLRWVSITTNAYRDKDGEWIGRKAIQMTVDYGDATGNRGTLNYWHTSLVLGDCDFQAITKDGRFLIESGTYRSALAARIGQQMAAQGWQMSPGFIYDELMFRDKVYQGMIIRERSPCPPGRASNPYTKFIHNARKELRMAFRTKTKEMSPEKRKQLAQLLGDESLLSELLGTVDQADRAASAQSQAKEEVPAWAKDILSRLSAIEQKAAPPEATPAAEVEVELEDDMAEEEDTGEMTLSPADVNAIAEAVVAKLSSSMDEISTKMAAIDNEMKTRGYSRAKEEELVKQINQRLAVLEGEAPRAVFQPSIHGRPADGTPIQKSDSVPPGLSQAEADAYAMIWG